MSGLLSLGPVSSALLRSGPGTATTGDKPAPPAKGAFTPDGSNDGDKEKEQQKELALCTVQHRASLSHLMEDYFWMGSSMVAFSRWRLGYMVEKCMSCMQTGTQMVKLRGGSKGLVRYFYLDQHKSCIRWRPSRKNEKAKISIDSIREVCEGKQSEIFQRYSEGSFDPNCCFSLYYGEHMESLDLVSGTGEEARTWITGLRYLMAGISDEDSLSKRQRTRDQWLKTTFTEADKNGDGTLSISEVLQLLHKLNVNLPRQKVKQMFKEADTDDNQGTLDFEEFCSFYKMMSTRRDLYLLMLTYSNHKDNMDANDIARFLETEQKMTKVTKDHCLEIINKFEPCSQNQKQGVMGIDGFTNYMRSPAGDIFRPEHYEVNQDMDRPLCHYFIASSHNTYLMGDQLMSQSRVDMYTWVLQAGCRCVEVDCWDGQDGEPIVHHGYTLTSKILFKDVIETINKNAFVKNDYPVILSIENHCSVPQQKKMAEYLSDILGDKLDLSSVKAHDGGHLPSPESLRGKILVKGKKLPPNIDEDAEEGDVSDEDSADEMEDDCKLMNGDTSANRKQVESLAKKKLDSLMKESQIRDREDPDSFTIAGLPPTGKPTTDQGSPKSKGDDGTDTADESNSSGTKRGGGRSFMGSFSKRKKKASKLKKASSLEDTDTDPESSSSASRVPLSNKKKKTMKLSRALSDLVKYTRSVGLNDIDAQAESLGWQVSSLSETKAHQVMMQKAAAFIHFNQRQLSRIYPSSYRVDSSNFNPQPFWNAGCQLVALNYQSEGRVLQLNRAKFYSNGNCGYTLKPTCMCEGVFNPHLEDPLPGQMKKQLVLKIISGQQLPKPKDSMLGDRGEIIDPFVEVEVIGLPADCCKEQTRVVDDNGFNPMWEETLVFTLHMPELALVRFLVWDHDPIGQDFIGQRTIAFNSMMTGYRHVYLEGMEEASIFVHIAVHDITGKARAASGIKGLFHRNPKQSSLDSHAAAQLSRKHPFGAHLLRRTASAPTKGQPKVKKGLPEIAIDTKDYSSEGASEDRESEEQGGGAAVTDPQDPTTQQQQHQHQNGAARDHPGTTNGALRPEEGKECVAEQRPAAPLPHLPPPSREEAIDRATRPPTSNPAAPPNNHLHPHSSVSLSHRALPPAPPPSPSTAITNGATPIASPNVGVVVSDAQPSHPTTRGHPKKPIAPLSRTTTSPGTLLLAHRPTSPGALPQCGQDPWVAISTSTPIPTASSCTPDLRQAPRTNPGDAQTGPLGGVPAAQSTGSPTVQKTPVRRALFTPLPSHPPVRRSKSEGHVLAAVLSDGRSCVPEVCTDATMNDRLWSKVDPGSHRDSMSSSSSISSSDTVIDLSMPNLVRKGLSGLPPGSSITSSTPSSSSSSSAHPDSPWVSSCRSSYDAGPPYDGSPVAKSKSNPNLWPGASRPDDELHPRPLGTPRGEPPRGDSPLEDSPGGLTQRRHTWSRLYMDGLRQQSSSADAKRASLAAPPPAPASSMSKSLGDLTSDDIACNFDSKYRSISRSFVPRPPREQLLRRAGSLHGARPPSSLTEQLRRLTDVEPLTASDFSSPARHSAGHRPPPEEQQQQQQQQQPEEEEPLARRTSSRSQSRVRYIANRAKQAQERQRLQGLAQGRSGSIGSPIGERGNPEGACCVARSPCTSHDPLGQLAGLRAPLPRPLSAPPDPDNKEVFFMLKL
ncbi:1-phosphatidylinositol 4,5-bisphosphate phosphodiesterase eta-2a isoform X2 [Gadus macrocephalus]|uniref:1-phosphatidylinositol 4,5-bisphosphate phosphodiesterase eta-2a isoform X2 n=1 Tax=Gadus macrocephalus TaxID=80720 RepID=UPI0028CB5D03|nr:1-phosphatidylinositol 4,5-bisphosphate phosphodiesterase eta-2a isoform X2 [Gadus macrocephalus]